MDQQDHFLADLEAEKARIGKVGKVDSEALMKKLKAEHCPPGPVYRTVVEIKRELHDAKANVSALKKELVGHPDTIRSLLTRSLCEKFVDTGRLTHYRIAHKTRFDIPEDMDREHVTLSFTLDAKPFVHTWARWADDEWETCGDTTISRRDLEELKGTFKVDWAFAMKEMNENEADAFALLVFGCCEMYGAEHEDVCKTFFLHHDANERE